jgi:putative SOS response-associated peptidase YedK
MCYSGSNHNAAKKIGEKLKKSIQVSEPVTEAHFISGFMHPNMHIIQQDQPDIVKSAKWGLVPAFITDPIKAKVYLVNTLNAKAETVFEKVSFKNTIHSQRCLIPAAGFYEWRCVNKEKYPYFISLRNTDFFLFGGIYDSWRNKITGEVSNTFSIITTEANPLMAKIHNQKMRQPLIFTAETAQEWLNPNLSEKGITELMQPLNELHMRAHTIKKIDPKKTDVFSDELVKAFEYPELVFYDL